MDKTINGIKLAITCCRAYDCENCPYESHYGCVDLLLIDALEAIEELQEKR